MVNTNNLLQILKELEPYRATLVAVSKTKPVETIKEVYNLGHRILGENYVQELTEKQKQLPIDIQWHFIGHLQSNKVKSIAPFISLIQGVDSLNLLKEINKQGRKNNRIINYLMQIHIAEEETKFGLSYAEADEILLSEVINELKNVHVAGLMGMATLTHNEPQIRKEFNTLNSFFRKHQALNSKLQILSMGMTSDYKIALEEGSNMVRIGSAIFGDRA
jgi:pyridoxal phosphate enzyme (YggS family)